MVRVTCPHCQSKLNAKEAVIGQMRKCPKCGQPVKIIPDDAAELAEPTLAPEEDPAESEEQAYSSDQYESEPSTGEETASDEANEGTAEAETTPTHFKVPDHLARANRYFICDSQRLVAVWESDGRGWMLKANHGYIPVLRNEEKIPSMGDFKLVELVLSIIDEKKRLDGVVVYQLAKRWALKQLMRGDDTILTVVRGPGALNQGQKLMVRQQLKDHFMRHVWENSNTVLDYLNSTDYHSPGVMEPR